MLTGPAGVGKSATIRALARPDALQFDIVEWLNPDTQADPEQSVTPFFSVVDRFSAFLQSVLRFAPLPLASRDSNRSWKARSTASVSLTEKSNDEQKRHRQRRIILVEDWPNLTHERTREGVHRALERFIHSAGQVPLVLIVSDTIPRADTDANANDTFSWRSRRAVQMDIRMAVPESVRMHPALTEIRFNPLTTRMILGALTAQAPAHIPRHVLNAIAEAAGGDIRSATNAVAMLKNVPPNNVCHESAAALGNESESALVLFHALGRVLYNKRAGDAGETLDAKTAAAGSMGDKMSLDICATSTEESSIPASSPPLPPWLVHRRPSLVNIETLWSHLPVDATTFQLYLHHNMLAFMDDTDEALLALEAMSFADTFAANARDSQTGSQSHTEQYIFQCVTRSLLLALPSPVPRRGQKLTKPTLMNMALRLRENQDFLSQVQSSLRTNKIPSANAGPSSVWDGSLQASNAMCRPDELATYVLPLAAQTHRHAWSVRASPFIQFDEPHAWTSSQILPQNDLHATDDVSVVETELELAATSATMAGAIATTPKLRTATTEPAEHHSRESASLSSIPPFNDPHHAPSMLEASSQQSPHSSTDAWSDDLDDIDDMD